MKPLKAIFLSILITIAVVWFIVLSLPFFLFAPKVWTAKCKEVVKEAFILYKELAR